MLRARARVCVCLIHNILHNVCSIAFDKKINIAAPTCRKEHTREYYSENGCRSRRPVKLAKCWGSCGNSCCLPRKTKRRKVHKTFVYQLELANDPVFCTKQYIDSLVILNCLV